MSFFNSFTSIVNNFKEFYSEINTATLTGAIDVIVIEQENGDLKSSPFHLRFGKLGVLKAREKIVDLEVNGEPVDLQMKLDDTGTAFFVENVEEIDQEEVGWERPDLLTSPIPDPSGFNWQDRRRTGNLKPMALFPETMPATIPEPDTETVCEDSETPIESLKSVIEESVIGTNLSRKGKLNKKKRRRRTQLRQSRRGSRVNMLKDASETESTDDMFAMDDVNDADLEDETGCSETGPSNLSGLDLELINKSFDSALVTPVSALKSNIFDDSIRNVNYQCASVEESHIPHIQKTEKTPEVFVGGGSQSVSANFHYFDDYAGKVDAEKEPLYLGIQPDTELNSMRGAEETQWRWGELPVPSPTVQKETEIVVKKEVLEEKLDQEVEVSVKNIRAESEIKKSWFGSWGGSKDVSPSKQPEPAGVFLEDIVSDPGKWAELGYLSRPVSLDQDPLDMSPTSGLEIRPREDDCESGTGPSLPMSPLSTVSSQAARYDLITSDCEPEMPPSQLSCEVTRFMPDLALSLCGGLADNSITPDMFESSLLTFNQLVSQLRKGDRDLVSDPRLVVRVHEKYLPWDQAAPIIMSVLLFKQPLPLDVTDEILKRGLDVNINIPVDEVITREDGAQMEERQSSSWFRWFGSGKVVKEEVKTDIKTEVVAEELTNEPQEDANNNTSVPGRKRKETETSSSDSDGLTDKKKYRKTLRLSSDKLSSLGLKPGSNEVQFSVTTAFQGTTVCRCHIYLWHHTDKLVISDIDGTITRSDVFGHILPLIGRDWTQSGVAQLFSKIKNNGYHIIYLSARAIGQSSVTKGYLQSLKQDDVCLPPGPVFLNPDSLLNAVRREVIDRNPEEFKIQCLKDIQSLFEEKQPFFAGYGNRPNDAYAYKHVGISEARIFTINPAGELSLSLTPAQNFQTSYSEQDSMVDMVFPPLGSQVDDFDPEFELQEFSSFGFWRTRQPELQLSEELSRLLT